ncbi:MAG: tRNA A-37 threonylcarbamoyl transferase component Bud32 [Polyangiales bacterium]|jgi:tRNA A-37 threonylcarbamoyl transferase component Bud32
MGGDDEKTIGRFSSVPDRTILTDSTPSADASNLSLPERYGNSMLLDEGGMGHVLLAQDRSMNRDVAVKRLRSEYAVREDLRIRFLREAEVQGGLEHPGVVPIYDVGDAPDGAPFFAMKRLQGKTLHTILNEVAAGDPVAQARFPLRRRIEILESVCQTLLFAHHRGVVHRDVKPANIMVGEFGEVYLLDWGIAKLMGQPVVSQQTRTGEQMGTPGYMAPEQAIGSLDIDERADVYSLGVVLFELLTLQSLFSGDPDDKIRATIQDLRDSPAERSPLLEIPSELDALCRDATAFDPKERMPSVRELHARILGWLDGERSASERARLAQLHTARASQLEKADPPAALRELSAALAIDPDDHAAMAGLLRLLAAPNESTPEAEAALNARATDNLVRSVGKTYWAYAAYLPCIAFIYLAGIRSTALFAVLLAMLVLTALTGALVRWRPSNSTLAVASGFGFAVLASISTLAGPFSMATGIVVGNGASLILATRATRGQRWILVLASALALSLPYILALLGLTPMPYRIEAGVLVTEPVMANFDPLWTMATATLATAVSLTATYHLVGQAVDRLKEAEREAFLRAWRLGKLLPAAASEAAEIE